MTHDLSELNQWTGMFAAGCLLALFFCLFVLGKIGDALLRFHEDYRKVNSLDEIEKSEYL
jgi:hypothetical protein